MTNQTQRTIVLGGGIAGLATARELIRRGQKVTLIEKNADVGGLARTLVYDDFRFDIGGHRFHSNNADVVNWVKGLLGSDLLDVPRFSHIRLGGKYVEYPIRFPGALSIFSPPRAARVLGSYAWAQIKRNNQPDISFEDWVVRRFGRAMYDVFFKPYTEKVWGIKTTELSSLWAQSRISLPSLAETVRQALISSSDNRPATIIDHFYYPRSGFGMICDRLQQEIEAAGGEIIANASVTALDPDKGTVSYQKDGSTYDVTGDRIVSTIPLTILLRSLPEESGGRTVADGYKLQYRDIILVDLALKRKQVSKDSWTYFPDPALIFGRTHEPKNWSAEMVPSQDVTSLATEIFSTRGEPVWQMDDEVIINKVVEQMDEIGWIQKQDLIKGWVVRVPFAYPVYYIGYADGVKKVREFLSRWPNLHLVGRTGAFIYMNSDGVIEDVFRLMGELFPDKPVEVAPLAKETERWA